MKITKKSRPNFRKEKPQIKGGKQSRKSGKGTSLTHVAAKAQSKKEAAESNMSPDHPVSDAPAPNRADHELTRLTKGNC